MHAEDLVKEYHRRHPLNLVERGTGQGTKKLIRALRTPISSPSPTDKVKTWLLANNLETFPLHTRVAQQSMSECSPSPPTSLWPSTPFKSSRKPSLGQVRKMPGNSYRGLHDSYKQMFKVGEEPQVPTKEPPLTALKRVLLRATRLALFLRTLPCQTLPNGRGRPL